MTYQAKVIAGGKIVIPSELRHEFGIKDGDSLMIERDPAGGIVVKTYSQVVGEVQSKFRALRGDGPRPATSVVDELIAERRENALREAADADAWSAARG